MQQQSPAKWIFGGLRSTFYRMWGYIFTKRKHSSADTSPKRSDSFGKSYNLKQNSLSQRGLKKTKSIKKTAVDRTVLPHFALKIIRESKNKKELPQKVDHPKNASENKQKRLMNKEKEEVVKVLVECLKKIDLKCPICAKILIDPSSTTCGHTFCYKCLDDSSIFCGFCKVCRSNIKGEEIVRCQLLQKLIERNLCHFLKTKQGQEEYEQRMNISKKWREGRTLSLHSISETKELDFCDSSHSWQKATVKKRYPVNGKPKSLLIQYKKSNCTHEQLLLLPSNRIASSGFYTERVLEKNSKRQLHENSDLSDTANQTSGHSEGQFGQRFFNQLFRHNILSNIDTRARNSAEANDGSLSNPTARVSSGQIAQNFQRELINTNHLIERVESQSPSGEESIKNDDSSLSKVSKVNSQPKMQTKMDIESSVLKIEVNFQTNGKKTVEEKAQKQMEDKQNSEIKSKPVHRWFSDSDNSEVLNSGGNSASNCESIINCIIDAQDINIGNLGSVLVGNQRSGFNLQARNSTGDQNHARTQQRPQFEREESEERTENSSMEQEATPQSDVQEWEIVDNQERRQDVFAIVDQESDYFDEQNSGLAELTESWLSRKKVKSQGSANLPFNLKKGQSLRKNNTQCVNSCLNQRQVTEKMRSDCKSFFSRVQNKSLIQVSPNMSSKSDGVLIQSKAPVNNRLGVPKDKEDGKESISEFSLAEQQSQKDPLSGTSSCSEKKPQEHRCLRPKPITIISVNSFAEGAEQSNRLNGGKDSERSSKIQKRNFAAEKLLKKIQKKSGMESTSIEQKKGSTESGGRGSSSSG